MNELIKLLNSILPGKGEISYGDTKIVYDILPDGYNVRLIKNPKGSDYDIEKAAKENAEALKKKEIESFVNGFTKTMDLIDDDLFTEACEVYDKLAPISLNEFGKALNEKNIKDYKLLKEEAKRFCNIVLNISRLKVDYFSKFVTLINDYMK